MKYMILSSVAFLSIMVFSPVFAQVENTGIVYQQKNGFWGDYFLSGDVVHGEAYYYDRSIHPEKVNEGTVDIRMTTPEGKQIIVADDVPIMDSVAKFEIPITEDFSLGKYLLRAITTVNGATAKGHYESRFYVSQEQNFEYKYENESLPVSAQYIEYDISPLRFDIDSKSLSFDFKRLDGKFASDDSLSYENTIGLVIRRPLIYPPYTVIIEPKGDEPTQFQVRDYRVQITEDGFYKYQMQLGKEWKEGTATIVGTYAIPEFNTVVAMVLAGSFLPVIILRSKFFVK